MFLIPTFLCLLVGWSHGAATSSGINLYTGANDGNLTSLKLSKSDKGYILEQTSVTGSCGAQPVWLDLDKPNSILYCLNRPGSISTYQTSETGKLSDPLDTGNTTIGPVSSAFYNSGEKRGLAAAHYAGGAVTAWNAPPGGDIQLIQTFLYPPPVPVGPDPAQNASHCHDVVVDFTGKYLVVPDLGYDLLRVYKFDADTNHLTEISTVPTARGTGPRHGLFWSPDPDWLENRSAPLYFYALAERNGTITSWRVTYPEEGGLHFEELQVINSYPGPTNINASVHPAEIELSPDNRFIYTSNRNDSYYVIPALSPGNSSTEASDSLTVFAPQENGFLEVLQYHPAGGLMPRHFKLNKAGDLVAVSLQDTHRVAIIERDVNTGLLGDFVAHVDTVGQAVVTIWDE